MHSINTRHYKNLRYKSPKYNRSTYFPEYEESLFRIWAKFYDERKNSISQIEFASPHLKTEQEFGLQNLVCA